MAHSWLVVHYMVGNESRNLRRAKELAEELIVLSKHARSRLALEKEVEDPVIKIDLAHINIRFFQNAKNKNITYNNLDYPYRFYNLAEKILDDLAKLPPSTFVGWEVEWYKQTKKLLDELETGRRKIANGDYLKEGYEGMMIKRTQDEKNEQ